MTEYNKRYKINKTSWERRVSAHYRVKTFLIMHSGLLFYSVFQSPFWISMYSLSRRVGSNSDRAETKKSNGPKVRVQFKL